MFLKKNTKFIKHNNEKLLVPKHVTVVDEEFVQNLKDQDLLDKAALLLRKSVLQAETNKLPNNLTAQDMAPTKVGLVQLWSQGPGSWGAQA